MLGWYSDGWWIGTEEEQRTLNETFGCDRYDREAILQYTLAISRAEFLTDLSTTSISGIVSLCVTIMHADTFSC